MANLIRRDGNWARVIEAAQREAGDDEAWAQGVVDSLDGLFFTKQQATLAVVGHSPSCGSARYLALPQPRGTVLAPTLQHGLSNEQIAAIRSRSVRTIANQVASLLRKTKSGSRRDLLVRPRARLPTTG